MTVNFTDRNDLAYKKLERAVEGAKALADHEAAADATRKKTERLRSERLAKEAADKQVETIAKRGAHGRTGPLG